MIIDLNKIRDNMIIEKKLEFTPEYYKNTDIRNLNNVSFSGKIFNNYDNDLEITGVCEGTMVLPDSLSLEDIEYSFSFDIDYIINENNEEIKEYYEKMKNTLDIMGILWQNIVLEVPMRITNTSIEEIDASGNGWELVNEKKKEIDPRLAKLSLLLDEDTGKE